jgi:hypothetical protein
MKYGSDCLVEHDRVSVDAVFGQRDVAKDEDSGKLDADSSEWSYSSLVE